MYGNLLNNWKKRIIQYIETHVEVFKLNLIGRISNILGSFIFVLITMFLLCLVLIFAGFGLAEAFASLFDSRTVGYFAASGVFVLFIIAVFLLRKSILNTLIGVFIGMLTADDDEEDNKEEGLTN